MNELDYIKRYGVTREQWVEYNRRKQREYRNAKRGKDPREYIKRIPEPYRRWDDVFMSEGHCGCCGMLLSSEYHQGHPLVGCLKWAEKHPEVPPFVKPS